VPIKLTLRALFLGLTLIFGSLGGVSMRPEEIEQLMNSMNQTRICQIIRQDGDDIGGPPET
jgi:hypothetical protein